jgi:hypothetical protein
MNTDMYIFRALTYIKKVNKFVLKKKNVKLSYTRTREILKESLGSIGLKAVDFGLYSFRSGGATAAYSCGVSDRLLKIHGRWKSGKLKMATYKKTFKSVCQLKKILEINYYKYFFLCTSKCLLRLSKSTTYC